MTTPRTMAECNKRLREIGEELASYRITPHPHRRELELEEKQLKVELLEAMDREGEANMIRERVEAGRRERETAERQKCIDAQVKAELGRTA